MRRVVLVSLLGVAFGAYAVVGEVAFLTHGDGGTGADALADYARDTLGRAVRTLIVAALLATFPLIALEGIHNVRALLQQQLGPGSPGAERRQQRRRPPPSLSSQAALDEPLLPGGGGGDAPGGGGAQLVAGHGQGQQGEHEHEHGPAAGWRSHRSIAVGWVLASTGVAAAVADTGKVLALIGSTCAIPQMLILPPLMAITTARAAAAAAAEQEGGAGSGIGGGIGVGGVGGGGGAQQLGLGLPHAVLATGVVLFLACTYSSLAAFG
jgi:hypothetical protein